jgi:hypothetical protein
MRGQGLDKGETAEVIGLKTIACLNYAQGMEDAYREEDAFIQWMLEGKDV